ncbi:MAG: hypothetical protein ACLT2F_09805 [Butyricicoccus sp.]
MADTGKLKRENTAPLRQAMQNGSAGKNDLARLTHLSFPTVSRIVDEMVERGEAQEIGTAAPPGDAAPCSTGCSCVCGWSRTRCTGLCATSTAHRSNRNSRPAPAMCANFSTRF